MGNITRHSLETMVFYIGPYKHRKEKQTEWSDITLESSTQQLKLNTARGAVYRMGERVTRQSDTIINGQMTRSE